MCGVRVGLGGRGGVGWYEDMGGYGDIGLCGHMGMQPAGVQRRAEGDVWGRDVGRAWM